MRAHLAKVRREGLATSIDENTNSSRGVAAPVWNANGEVTAVLAIHGPTQRFSRDRIRALAKLTRQAAQECSTALQWPGSANETRGG